MSHNDPRQPDRYQSSQVSTAMRPDGQLVLLPRQIKRNLTRGTIVSNGAQFRILTHREVWQRERSRYPLPVPPASQHAANERRLRRGY